MSVRVRPVAPSSFRTAGILLPPNTGGRYVISRAIALPLRLTRSRMTALSSYFLTSAKPRGLDGVCLKFHPFASAPDDGDCVRLPASAADRQTGTGAG